MQLLRSLLCSEPIEMRSPAEMILWSIAFPGFGQILNGRLLKGFVFLGLEFLINVNANINQTILFSFLGETEKAIETANYQWILFYPCVYVFAIWDAYRDAGGAASRYSFLPSVFSAYCGTIGVLYSPVFTFFSLTLGPIWLGILGMLIGAAVGLAIKTCLPANSHSHQNLN